MSGPQAMREAGWTGYVGNGLVPGLLACGHGVLVLDLYLYRADVLALL